jgi:hypothetical protein
LAPIALVLLRIVQKVHDLHQALLGLVLPRHVGKGDAVAVCM